MVGEEVEAGMITMPKHRRVSEAQIETTILAVGIFIFYAMAIGSLVGIWWGVS